MTNEERKALSERTASVTGLRHCRVCGRDRSAEGGKWRLGRDGVKRWRCAACSQRQNPAGF